MEIPIMILAVIIGTILLVLTFAKAFSTKKTRNIFMWIGIISLGVAGLSFANIIPQTYNYVSTPATVSVATTTTTNQVGIVCAVEDTTVTLSAQDKYTSTATGGSHRYRINNNPALTVADAGTITASPGDSLSILWMNGSTTGHFAKTETIPIPCKGTYTASTQLVNNGTVTLNIYNTDDNLVANQTVNQTLSAGDVKTLRLVLQGSYQKEVPYGFVAVVEYNKSAIDSVTITGSNGVELSTASIPQAFASTGTSFSSKAYILPEQASTVDVTLKVTIDADDTVNPSQVGDGDISVTIYQRGYFINDKNGGAYEGPSAEDENNAVTRASTVKQIIPIG